MQNLVHDIQKKNMYIHMYILKLTFIAHADMYISKLFGHWLCRSILSTVVVFQFSDTSM